MSPLLHRKQTRLTQSSPLRVAKEHNGTTAIASEQGGSDYHKDQNEKPHNRYFENLFALAFRWSGVSLIL